MLQKIVFLEHWYFFFLSKPSRLLFHHEILHAGKAFIIVHKRIIFFFWFSYYFVDFAVQVHVILGLKNSMCVCQREQCYIHGYLQGFYGLVRGARESAWNYSVVFGSFSESDAQARVKMPRGYRRRWRRLKFMTYLSGHTTFFFPRKACCRPPR